MRESTVTVLHYEPEDYNQRRREIEQLSDYDLAHAISEIAADKFRYDGYDIPDGNEEDFNKFDYYTKLVEAAKRLRG